MTTEATEASFPGARSTVPGFHRLAERSTDGERLRLEPNVTEDERGWMMRLPVRAEEIQVEKRAVIYERVVVRRASLRNIVRLEDTIRREELEIDGDLADA